MNKRELIQQLMATFLEELNERVAEMNSGLLALEKDPHGEQRAEHLKSLFRAAHSLKGAARSVGVEPIETACHRLEDVLAPLRDQPFGPGAEFAPLFKTVDAIEEIGMRLREEQLSAGAPLEALAPQVEPRSIGTEPAAVPSTAGPAPPVPLPAGIAHKSAVAAISAAFLPPATKVGSAALSAAATVRVPAEKLDVLLAQCGELLVARRRVKFRVAELAALQDSVAAWKADWRCVEKPLRRLLAECGQTGRPREPSGVRLGSPDLPQRPDGRTSKLSRRSIAVLAQVGNRIRKLERELDQLATNLIASGRLLTQTCESLDSEVHRVRMLPFAEACGGLERAVRDLARATNKSVQLVVQGEDVEMDRSVLEGLKDPLLHLVRNAVDHGIEPPAERRAAGKPSQGQITVAAAFQGGRVEVVVADDGRGFDLPQIREKARKLGLPETADDRELARLVFLPGFSTANIVTEVSGRGVGLDVVLSRIEALHGTVDVQFQAQGGSQFVLNLPLTLTTIRTVLARAADQTFAVATSSVQQLVRFDADQVRSLAGGAVLLLGDTPIPIAPLAETLGMQVREPTRAGGKLLGIILAAGGGRVVFIVDEVLAEQDVVVKRMGQRIRRLRHVSGATLLPSGRMALVLNAPNLIRTALGRTSVTAIVPSARQLAAEVKRKLLVVEDSVTTRTLMKSILETAGYEVLVAVDGQHAWELLPDLAVDLVITDVDMPRMNGFALAEAIRGSHRFANMPVVLVTARETDQDKARGIEVGANAYLIKSAFDQSNLLETISQLL